VRGFQSFPTTVDPGTSASWRFFALYDPDHPTASDDGDLAKLHGVEWPDGEPAQIPTRRTKHSLVQDSPPARVVALSGPR
jgi:hypothetical protein